MIRQLFLLMFCFSFIGAMQSEFKLKNVPNKDTKQENPMPTGSFDKKIAEENKKMDERFARSQAVLQSSNASTPAELQALLAQICAINRGEQ